jgi:hypothetical protein
MDIEEALDLADHLTFTSTGKHLDNLQKAILRGAWDNQKYKAIADSCHRSEKYVKEVGFKLWKTLSEALGAQTLCQANFRAKLENITAYNVSVVGNNSCLHIGKISTDTLHSLKNSHSQPQQDENHRPDACATVNDAERKVYLDLADAPESNTFYGRTQELSTLKEWILSDSIKPDRASSPTHIITLLGLSGMGKTALTLQLIPEIQDNFDYIIWRSLRTAPTLATLQTDIIEFISQNTPPLVKVGNKDNPPLSRAENDDNSSLPRGRNELNGGFLEYVRSHRCLIILDDMQMIFNRGQLAGNYKSGYEDYGTFFKQMGETSHNSCLILLSWEKSREIATLESENRPVRTLELNGLGAEAQEILRDKGLAEEEKWSDLINLYQGNPAWLFIITAMIQDLFDGNLNEFMALKNIFLGDLESLLDKHFQRLSDLEKNVILGLAIQQNYLDVAKFSVDVKLSLSDLLRGLESLGRRLLIEKVKQGDKTFFTVSPVLKEYVTNNYEV